MNCKPQQQRAAPKASVATSTDGMVDRFQSNNQSAASKSYYSARYDPQPYGNLRKPSQSFTCNKQCNHKETTNKKLTSRGTQPQDYEVYRCVKPERYTGTSEVSSWNENYRSTKSSIVSKSHSLDIREDCYQNGTDFQNKNNWSRKPISNNRKSTYDSGMGFQKLNNFIFLVDSPDVYGKRTQNNSQSYWCKSRNNYASNSEQNSSEENNKRGIKNNAKNNAVKKRDNHRGGKNSYNCQNSNFNKSYRQYQPINERNNYYPKRDNRKPFNGFDNNQKQFRSYFVDNAKQDRNFSPEKKNAPPKTKNNNKAVGIEPKNPNVASFNYPKGKYVNNFKGYRQNFKNSYTMPRNGYTYGSNNVYSYGVDNYTYCPNAIPAPYLPRYRCIQQQEIGGEANRSYSNNYNQRNQHYQGKYPKNNIPNNPKSSCPNFKDYDKVSSVTHSKNSSGKDGSKPSAISKSANYSCKSEPENANKNDRSQTKGGTGESEKVSSPGILDSSKLECNSLQSISSRIEHSTTM